MSAYTKGPWADSRQSEAGRYIVITDSNGKTVARVMFSAQDDNSPSDASNAKLIAAAPELLEVVELLYFRALGEIPDGRNIVEMAKDAIAKARGEA